MDAKSKDYYKNKINKMNDPLILKKWEEFINDPLYKKYIKYLAK